MANKESNSYIFMYSTILVVVAAAVLAVAAVGLRPFQKKNQEIEKMQQLLTAVGIENDVKSFLFILKPPIKILIFYMCIYYNQFYFFQIVF